MTPTLLLVRTRQARPRREPRIEGRTVGENLAVAELVCRAPNQFHEELVTWATDQLLPIYEERRRARQAFRGCDDEVRPPKNEE